MVSAVFVCLILLVIAWAFYQFIPHPIGTVFACIVGLLALLVLVRAVAVV